MKVCLISFFVATSIVVTAQTLVTRSIMNKADSLFQFFPNSPLKAVVNFNQDSVLKGNIVEVNQEELLLSLEKGMGNTEVYSISVSQIKFIKIKRHKFWMGAGMGAFLGGLLGYYLGKATYDYNSSIFDYQNSEQSSLRGYTWAAISVVPSAVIGSIVNAIFTKTRFQINGNKGNLKKMATKLWEY